jgi:hypothetical protein
MKFSDQQSPEDIALEQQLRAMQPAPLSKATLHRLEQSLESAVSNDESNSVEQHTILQPAAGKDGSWRPVLWSIAAMLMIGLWLISVYLPGQSAEQLAQARQHIPAGKEIVLNQHSPEIQTVSNNPPPEEATVERNMRLTNVHDEGIVMSIGNIPMKRLRYEFIDTYQWPTAEGSGRMRMEVPREDFVLVPVSTY